MTNGPLRMRSKLFVPAIRPDLYEKAMGSAADAICFDLEDAVPLDRKDKARAHLEAFLTASPAAEPLLLVRTNAVDSAEFSADLDACVRASVYAVALPKVESAQQVVLAAEAMLAIENSRGITKQIGLLPTVESPRGLHAARDIANSSPRVIGLQVGYADLLESLGISAGNEFVRNQIRFNLRLAAAEISVDCYDSAFPNFQNAAGFAEHLNAAQAMGFAGSSCIHPSQIAAANQAFTPSADALAHAQRIVAAAARALSHGQAVTQLDGQMIDRPFVLQAQRLLSRAPKGVHNP